VGGAVLNRSFKPCEGSAWTNCGLASAWATDPVPAVTCTPPIYRADFGASESPFFFSIFSCLFLLDLESFLSLTSSLSSDDSSLSLSESLSSVSDEDESSFFFFLLFFDFFFLSSFVLLLPPELLYA
jgi:hypothetical protein